MKNGLLLLNCDAKKQECCLVIFTEFINILGKNSPPTIQQFWWEVKFYVELRFTKPHVNMSRNMPAKQNSETLTTLKATWPFENSNASEAM